MNQKFYSISVPHDFLLFTLVYTQKINLPTWKYYKTFIAIKCQDITKNFFKYFLSYLQNDLMRLYNCFFQLSGGLQIFFGATFAWNHLSYSIVLGNNFWMPSTILLCLGPVTYLLCWLGWNAVSKKNRNYLKIVSKLFKIIFKHLTVL